MPVLDVEQAICMGRGQFQVVCKSDRIQALRELDLAERVVAPTSSTPAEDRVLPDLQVRADCLIKAVTDLWRGQH